MIDKFYYNMRHSVLLLILIMFVFFLCPNAYSESLFVFYPTKQRPHVIRKKLNEAFPKMKIVVFGRYKDFKKEIKNASPDAILTKIPMIEQIGNYSVKLKGNRGGSTDEPYVFLSVNEKIDLNGLSKLKVGVLGILDRKGMKSFIGKYFSPVPKLKRVLKIEDLQELLTFNMVKAVLIPEYHVGYYKKRSKLNFIVTPAPNMSVNIIALAVKDETRASLLIKAVRNMDDAIGDLLGIDKWE